MPVTKGTYYSTPLFDLNVHTDTYFTKAGKYLLNQSFGAIRNHFSLLDPVTIAVAGGSFRSYFLKETPIDLDLFILSDRATASKIIISVRDSLKKQYPDITFEPIAYIDIERNSIDKEKTIKKVIRFNIPVLPNSNTPIQLLHFSHDVGPYEVSPSCGRELLNSFDIVPACFAAEAKIFCTNQPEFLGVSQHPLLLESLINKTLLPNEVKGRQIIPSIDLNRFYKYTAKYGFSVSKKDMETFSDYMFIPTNARISYHSDYTDSDSASCTEDLIF